MDEQRPTIERVDLTEMQDAGILLAANISFFWKLGLALTWTVEDGKASGLYISQWRWPDGHHETIELEPNDEILPGRRAGWQAWLLERIDSLPEAERAGATALLGVLDR